jgi:arginase
MGPSAFRIAGLGERIAALGPSVVDEGDLEVPIPETRHAGDDRKKYIEDIATVCKALFETSVGALESGGFPLVLGGDHSLAAGSVAATSAWARNRGGRVGLIWVDAHGDMNTPASTTSGNVHGMPLAALIGPEPAELASLGGFGPKVDPDHTVLIGLRNLDARERERVRESRIHVFTMKDIDRNGIAAVIEQAIQLAGRDALGLHVSFDLDACDPAVAPGVGTPVKGGLDYREAHMVMEVLADSGQLVALDMVEVNPTLDVRNSTAELGTELVLSALGMKIL